ncbi:MAG: hypothetical protein L0Z62_35140 [Gemmataceae bacterium]|nr:hypothetical protein [Gemmataceae bacterium]
MDNVGHALTAALRSLVGVPCAWLLATNSIRLRFESGHRIETFSYGGPGCHWYYMDRVTGEVFEAGAWGIRHVFDKPAASRSSG